MVTALRRLPGDLPAGKLAQCQEFLVDAAQRFDPDGLANLGRALWTVIDPAGADKHEAKTLEDEEELARAKAYFKSWRNGDGTTGFRGKLPDAQFDMLNKLITAYAAPRRRNNTHIPTPNPHGPNDQPDSNQPDGSQPDGQSGGSTGGQPNGQPDAQPDGGPGPGTGPVARPAGGPDAGPGGGSEGGSGAGFTGGPGAPCDDPQAQPHPAETQTGKQLPWPVIRGLGLIDLIEHLPADAVPYTGGMPATLLVLLDYDQLISGLGSATLDTGTKISASQARRMACAAGIIPVVLDGESQPLDIGRAQRAFTRYQRAAMVAREHARNKHTAPPGAVPAPTCVIEGCDREVAWTIGHHKKSWSQGGPTSIANGALPCDYHHTLIHHPAWTTTWLPNGKARLHKTDRTRD